MDKFNVKLTMTHTGHAPGWDLPIPLGWDMLYGISKKEVPDRTRAEFHEMLDHWLDRVSEAPDQYGSRVPCFFKLEYRGDNDKWRSTDEELAEKTKKLISVRLSQIISID